MTQPLAVTITLAPEQLEAMALRVAEILSERQAPAVPDLLTVEEAAALLRCTRKRIYRMASDGRLERVKDGGRLLIPRNAVERHLRGEAPDAGEGRGARVAA